MFYDNAINRPLEKKPTSLYNWAPEGLSEPNQSMAHFFAADGPVKKMMIHDEHMCVLSRTRPVIF